MTPGTPTSTAPEVSDYVEGYLTEDEVLQTARARGAELGCPSVGPGAGAALRFLAATLRARAVVEVGTGSGVSGLWLLRGMAPDGVLTSIDVEPEHQRAAKRAFAEAGVAPGRTRLIMGQALEVLPRLTDGGYDLVLVAATKTEYPRCLEEGVRLLRPGGVIVFDNALGQGRVADPAHRDPETVAIREVARAVRDDESLVPVLLPLDGGLLAATKL
ncbi:putative O-methyltransferase YrrM [Streptoalloteichus tenebrarius]|uniref:O-methyltransferase YrrM n=1 Tax=Streptoalloteichus tenebrarius (strain ATCC 17920 / DSM 40477 / JCM 4838 / CBS 697.72 / NBRC 16177 / NCIMB 11028 / NRRL B-12390 / A12253. 1 / ISP 5477) TaxID=1933 RepID=A0ABT1I273_STRSD|nr:O-methyltransferase [Streptoalloteichus tenebrarius]MCP2261888.1 putative O-methyltransferase YrrM [Streptoalloteichus tenebrarius]BFF01049.1 O-methyltransferase [Streptoalloteichus tenebrarius]